MIPTFLPTFLRESNLCDLITIFLGVIHISLGEIPKGGVVEIPGVRNLYRSVT